MKWVYFFVWLPSGDVAFIFMDQQVEVSQVDRWSYFKQGLKGKLSFYLP